MNKTAFITMALGAVLLVLSGVSCSKGSAPVSDGDSSFTVSQITVCPPVLTEDETKAEGGAVIYRVYWNIGDKLAIVNVSQGNRIDTYTSLTRVENTNGSGQFQADAVYSYDPGDVVFAVYPYEAITNISNGATGYKVTVQMTDYIDYYSRSNSPMFSKNDIEVSRMLDASSLKTSGSQYPGITMNRMIGMVRLLSHVSDSEVSRQRVNSVKFGVKGAFGQADVVFSGMEVGASPSITANSGSADEITINLPNHPTVGTGSALLEFLPLFPARLIEDGDLTGYTLRYYTDTHEVGFHRTMSNTLGSNQVMAMNIFEGAYTRVKSSKEAVGDYKWWYILKTGGESWSGGFGGEGETHYGSSPGGFISQ